MAGRENQFQFGIAKFDGAVSGKNSSGSRRKLIPDSHCWPHKQQRLPGYPIRLCGIWVLSHTGRKRIYCPAHGRYGNGYLTAEPVLSYSLL
jgi:hypothetical protein